MASRYFLRKDHPVEDRLIALEQDADELERADRALAESIKELADKVKGLTVAAWGLVAMMFGGLLTFWIQQAV